MTFVDASALVAVINQESGWEEILKRLAAVQNSCAVSPLVRFEATMGVARAAAARRGARTTPELILAARGLVDDLLREIGAAELAITSDVGNAAIDAAGIYGKVVGHPADLNFGDCFTYACAKAGGMDLVYKGADFAGTDLA